MPELKFTKSTDKQHEIILDSYLIYSDWRKGTAYAGQTATFEIGTSFVGNGAKIKVIGKSKGGENLGKTTSNINNNKFFGSFDIPENIEIGDDIYFEVELPKNNLKGESSRIPVYPQPKVSNLKWSAKEARRGDTLTLTADIENLYSGTEVLVTIYEYDNDGAHEKITEIPTEIKDNKIELFWEYEYHEDTAKIASEDELQLYDKKNHYAHPEYIFTITIGETEYGKDQESRLLTFKDWVELELYDGDFPLVDEEYVVYLPDGRKSKGTLDSNGYARLNDVPPGEIKIEFPAFANLYLDDE